jgi:hypothetical protein
MELDNITYGNPNTDQLPFLTKESYLDYLFGELSLYTFPKNSSEATKEELNQLVDYLETMELDENKNLYLNRYKAYDKNLKKYIIEGLVKGGHDEQRVNNLVHNLIEDTKPLLIKLKYHFQRPRPYQLAEYYKLKLFPFESSSANSPSFPSGHTFQGRIITEVIGNVYPKTYSFMQALFDDISYSRMFMGLHYQSDVDSAIYCADKVLESIEFKEKYKI